MEIVGIVGIINLVRYKSIFKKEVCMSLDTEQFGFIMLNTFFPKEEAYREELIQVLQEMTEIARKDPYFGTATLVDNADGSITNIVHYRGTMQQQKEMLAQPGHARLILRCFELATNERRFPQTLFHATQDSLLVF